jgi:D-alanyl-D-alanine carboxypeptidase
VRIAAAAALVLAAVAAGCDAAGPDELDAGQREELTAEVTRLAADADAGVVVQLVSAEAADTIAAGPAGPRGGSLDGTQAFRVASLTKLVTATVALQLAEDGQVELDAPVVDVLGERIPRFEHGSSITLRQLLAHTAGLPQDPDEDRYARAVLPRVRFDDDVAALDCDDVAAIDHPELTDPRARFAPGADRAYSNVGYHLVGDVIETVTGRTYEQEVRDRILDPLELTDSWFDCAEPPRTELAGGLHPPGHGPIEVPGQGERSLDVTDLHRDTWAAGGLLATAADMATFARALFDGELFDDPDTLEQMLTGAPNLAPVLGEDHGLGVQLDGDVVGHSGSLLGYTSLLRHDLDTGVTLVVLAGTSPPAAPGEARLTTRVAEQVRRTADLG